MEGMDVFLIYIATVLCAGVRSVLTKQNGRMGGIEVQFNLLRALSAFVLFGALVLMGGGAMHPPTVLYGIAYGFLFFGSCVCGLRAMALGPLSITSSLVAFSLVLPCLFGALVLKEPIRLPDAVGFVLIVAAVLMMNRRTRGGVQSGGAKFKRGWGVFLCGTVVCDGLHAIVKTLHQRSYPGLYRYEFMCTGMLVGTLLFLLVALQRRRVLAESERALVIKSSVCGAAAGIFNGLYNYFVLYLAASESAMALFPIVSVATIAVGLLSGRLIFKERLNRLQLGGVFVSMLAVLLMKI